MYTVITIISAQFKTPNFNMLHIAIFNEVSKENRLRNEFCKRQFVEKNERIMMK